MSLFFNCTLICHAILPQGIFKGEPEPNILLSTLEALLLSDVLSPTVPRGTFSTY